MIVSLLAFALSPAAAANRLALVIGESRYQEAPPLENPANDAHDFAQALKGLGFDVVEAVDGSRDALAKAVGDFSDRLPQADLALFYFAGHGLQINGENYLLPVDAKVKTAADIRFGALHLSDIQKEMESAGRTNILILDACRNNPFADKLASSGRSLVSRGLARIDASGQGSLIVYSTQPDNVALDGAGRNSPFTAALLKHMSTPGLEVRQMISRVRGDVLEATGKRQTPWDSSSLVGDVFLAGAGSAPPAPPPPAEPPASPQSETPRQAAASNGPESQCDAIAALRLDHASAAAPTPTDLDWPRAVQACQAATQAHPGEAHYLYQLARAQDHTGDYLDALRNYKTVAAAGFTEALYDIGAKYYYGQGVLQNYATALDYITRAAEAGSVRALGGLAGMYADGRGVPKDDAKSLDYAEKAVEAGNPFGLKVIADHYFNGAGVTRDYAMCAQYLQQAADLGDGQSMKFLANMYESGYLGAPDPAKANALRLRAQQIDPSSRDPIPARLPPLRALKAGSTVHASFAGPRRRYVIYHYNPVWQAAPGDTRCCPNNMLVCPLGRHFCGH
jgi:uncharacterized caspase-like protein